MKRNEECLQKFWHNIKRTNIRVTWVQEKFENAKAYSKKYCNNRKFPQPRRYRYPSIRKSKVNSQIQPSLPHNVLYSNLTGHERVACNFHSTEGINYQSRILYPAKPSFTSEGEIKIFTNKQKMREFIFRNCWYKLFKLRKKEMSVRRKHGKI